MPIEIVVPRLGWSMDEGVFAGWLISPGESIARGDMLFQLEGDKATQEIETFDTGELCVPPGAPQVGDTVAVGQVLGYLLTEGETAPTQIGDSSASDLDDPDSSDETISIAINAQVASELEILENATQAQVHSAADRSESQASTGGRGRTVATPRARRTASERGVDLAAVTGTGRGGRIRESDVVAVANAAGTQVAENRGVAENRNGTSPLRRTIAKRMFAGVHETAPVTLTKKVRVDRLIQFCAELKQHPVSGVSPSLNELVLKLTCGALQKHPGLNGTWESDTLHLSPTVELAFAVDTDAGLLAPVIPSAESLSLSELAEASRGLVEGARTGKLSQRELSGGTFTVSNLGGLGVDTFTPILNLPQMAILGIGRALQEPVVEEGQLAVGWTMQLSLTIDHRALDGADGARLLQTLGEMFEFPARWLFN